MYLSKYEAYLYCDDEGKRLVEFSDHLQQFM